MRPAESVLTAAHSGVARPWGRWGLRATAISYLALIIVAGVMLVVRYWRQETLRARLQARGLRIIFATPGIVLALLLVTYPFVIRAVQPVLLEMQNDQEEAAYTLGASKWVTFYRIILPTIAPGMITGVLLTFARALGEFGSIVVVAGNIPGRTLTAPVHVFGQIESLNPRW